MTAAAPTPASLGLDPSTFPSFRPGQWEAALALAEDPSDFAGLSAPPGTGKSLLAIVAAIKSGAPRIVYLTKTKHLQDQILRDFRSLSPHLVKGRSAYLCDLVDDGKTTAAKAPCVQEAHKCDLKPMGCAYYSTLEEAKTAPLVVTNYAAFISQCLYRSRKGPAFGHFDLMICDEAHNLEGCLIDALTAEIPQYLCRRFSVPFPKEGGLAGLRAWVETHRPGLRQQVDRIAQVNENPGAVVAAQGLLRSMDLIDMIQGRAVITREGSGEEEKVRVIPLMASSLASPYLFKYASKVWFLSATMTEETMKGLAIPSSRSSFEEIGSPFPVSHRPIYCLPTVEVNYRTTDEDAGILAHRVDEIIEARPGLRGVIHCVSYAWGKRIAEASKYYGRFGDGSEWNRIILAAPGTENARRALAQYYEREDAILISPSIYEGLDFKGPLCRFQIILKTPLPYAMDPWVKVKKEVSPDWAYAKAADAIAQAYGRGVRAEDDWCETFILDKSWGRWARARLWPFLSDYFCEAVQTVAELPPPLEGRL